MVITTKEELAGVFLVSKRTVNSSLYFFQLFIGNYLLFIKLKVQLKFAHVSKSQLN